ncbi:30S ribosomal protein S5 [Candidatus Woesebacteria bacterium]|nr:30S ribosomal protein S5 [Candidatus Woesebacteria bacterium]
MRTEPQRKEPSEFEEKVIRVSRVSKKTKGGNKMGFSVLMVVGDKKGRVGVGLGKAKDVQSAVKKGVKKAKKRLVTVPMNGTTIPFKVAVKLGAGQVMLKPAPKGSGIIAGGPVRAVVDAAGIRDISSKILGSSNQASSVYATFEALKQIERIVKLKGITLKSIAQSEAEAEAVMQAEQEKAKKKADERVEKEKTDRAEATKKAAPKKTAPVAAAEVKKVTKKTEVK